MARVSFGQPQEDRQDTLKCAVYVDGEEADVTLFTIPWYRRWFPRKTESGEQAWYARIGFRPGQAWWERGEQPLSLADAQERLRHYFANEHDRLVERYGADGTRQVPGDSLTIHILQMDDGRYTFSVEDKDSNVVASNPHGYMTIRAAAADASRLYRTAYWYWDGFGKARPRIPVAAWTPPEPEYDERGEEINPETGAPCWWGCDGLACDGIDPCICPTHYRAGLDYPTDSDYWLELIHYGGDDYCEEEDCPAAHSTLNPCSLCMTYGRMATPEEMQAQENLGPDSTIT